ncbi:MAG: hypothetical protein ACPGTP_04810 [Bacteroidia bacterium]
MKLGVIISLLLVVSSCAVYEYSDKRSHEDVYITSSEFDSPLRTEDMFEKKAVDGARGFITVPLLLKGADLAYQGIISVIDAKKEDNSASYKASLANQRFYGDVSRVGRMDPDHLSFRGFSITRSAQVDSEDGMTFKLDASLDTTKLPDIVAGSKFYLNIDTLKLEYAKLKYLDKRLLSPGTWFTKKDKKLNLDVSVDVIANWIDDEGMIHENVKMGSFFYPLRDFDIATLESQPLLITNQNFVGSSYLIPRSTTYCFDQRKKRIKCFGLGDFNVEVTITESKENSFVEKTFYENKGALIEAMKGQSFNQLIGE